MSGRYIITKQAVAGTKAQYKGTGTDNGAGSFGFLLTVIDGSLDKFHIKIWDKDTGEIIYDNQLGAADDAEPVTGIEGGLNQEFVFATMIVR